MGLLRIPAPLLLITDRQQARRPLLEIVEATLQGGCRWVSLREKDLPSDKRLALVEQLLPIVRRFGGTFLVHSDIEAAKLADGVHLQAGANIEETRRYLGEKALIGLSCHTLNDVANAMGADYVTLGPFATTASKPGYVPTLKPDVLGTVSRFGVPVLALGGVDETNVGMMRRAGAAGFAMMGSVMRSKDPSELVRRMVGAWEVASDSRSDGCGQ